MWGSGGAYREWAEFLERWAAGEAADPATLPALTPADFAGDSWARLTERITGALDRRLVAWGETLTRELAGARDEFAAARALNHARWGLPPIRALASAPAIPPELRDRLTGLVDSQIEAAQRQLDESAQRLRRDNVPRGAAEARLRTIRDNPLTVVTAGPHTTGAGWDAGPVDRPRRRVLLERPETTT
jgi:hypothetical protein